MRRFMSVLRRAALALLVYSLPVSVACAQGAPSPTGRTPKLIWTPERQAVWNRIAHDGGPMWENFQSRAAEFPARYGNLGDYATMAYQMTGDTAYARTAWKIIEPWITGMTLRIPNTNEIRQYFTVFVWEYDWLYPSLSADQRTRFIAWLNWMADEALGKTKTPFVCGAILNQSDRTMGEYFGLAFLDLATAPDNPRAGTFLKETFQDGDGGTVRSVGGLTPTGADLTTMRNAIAYYANLSRGGVWMQSWMYDLNTLPMLLMGVEGVRTAAGKDYFPEITALIPDLARAQLYELTPDLRDSYQWGDVEQNRQLWMQWRQTTAGMLEGLTAHQPDIGPWVHTLVDDFATSPVEFAAGASPFPTFWLFFDPYAPRSPSIGAGMSAALYAGGQGMLYYHDGWDRADAFFGAQVTRETHCDHETAYTGDFQLYRHGEWAITHPISYGATAAPGGAPTTNTMLFAGLPVMGEARSPVAHDVLVGKYAYVKCVTGGQYVPPRYWDPPATFLHEWTRSIVYLPSAGARAPAVVVYDRTNAADPRSLPGKDRYYPNIRELIEKAPALKQWIIHTPCEPTISTNAISWRTAGGQSVNVATLLPIHQARIVSDEKKTGFTGYINDAEKLWDVRIVPDAARDWDTFLDVITVGDGDTASASRMVRSAGGEAEGALVSRAPAEDDLVLFDAVPGPAIPATASVSSASVYNPQLTAILRSQDVQHTSFTAAWQSTAPTTSIYLFDIDPRLQWTVRIDRLAAARLSVNASGVASATVAGAGPHTINLTPSN